MYAIVKEGVYLQDVWFYSSLPSAAEDYLKHLEEDSDDYHTWSLYKVKEGRETWELIKEGVKPMEYIYTRQIGGKTFYAKSEDSSIMDITDNLEDAFVSTGKVDKLQPTFWPEYLHRCQRKVK